MFVKNDDRYEEMVERMVSFREKTRKYWQHADGSDRSTWMTPATTYANSTDWRNRTIAKKFFWNDTQFEELQRVKLELDPDNLFSNKGTLPRPQDMYDQVVVGWVEVQIQERIVEVPQLVQQKRAVEELQT